MRVCRRLSSLQRPVLRRLVRIQARLAAQGAPPTGDEERELMLSLIEAQNTWAVFVRYFFLSCMLGAKTISGSRVTHVVPGINSEADALDFAKRTVPGATAGGPLSEPPWHTSFVLLRLCGAAGLSNASQIQTAWSVAGNALEHLPKARNFYAHRSRETARKLGAVRAVYGVGMSVRPGQLPGQRHPSSSGSIALAWVEELVNRVRLLPS